VFVVKFLIFLTTARPPVVVVVFREEREEQRATMSERVISNAYYAEQVIILAFSVFMIVGSTSQLYLQSKNPKNVKPLHKVYMSALLVAGILEFIWGIDPRGIWGLLSAMALAFVKDYVLVVLSFCGVFYLDIFCRVVFESLGRTWFLKIPQWLTCGIPLVVTVIVQIVLTMMTIPINDQEPRAYFIFFLVTVITMWTIGITISLVHIFSIRSKAGLNLSSNPAMKRNWSKMVKLAIALWIIVAAAMPVSILTIVVSRKRHYTLEQTQVIHDPAHYEFYPFLLFHIVSSILVYWIGKLPNEQSKGPAAVTPAATDVMVEGKAATHTP
jgi:hypothetical protein